MVTEFLWIVSMWYVCCFTCFVSCYFVIVFSLPQKLLFWVEGLLETTSLPHNGRVRSLYFVCSQDPTCVTTLSMLLLLWSQGCRAWCFMIFLDMKTLVLLKGYCNWGILRSPSWYSVKVHNRIISACCCLIHNFIRREIEADPLDVEMEFHMENQHEHENINTIETSDEWTTWRDELAQSMWNERLGNQSLYFKLCGHFWRAYALLFLVFRSL